MKKLSLIILLASSLSYAVDKKEDHTGGAGDKTHKDAVDKSPKLSKLISQLTRLGETNKNTLHLKLTNRAKNEDFKDKTVYPPDVKKIKALVEEAKNYIDNMVICGGKDGDNHAFEIADLIEGCMINQIGDAFIKDVKEQDLSKWDLRAGSQDPITAFESRIAQCRKSIGDVMVKRKEAKIKDTTADDALLAKFDDAMKVFEFSVEELTKNADRKVGPIHQSIFDAADAAGKSVKEKSCSVPKLTDKKPSKAKPGKNEPTDTDGDEPEDKTPKEPSDEEKKDPPALNPIPRGGPTESAAAGPGGRQDGRNPENPLVPGQQFPQAGLNGAIDPSLGQNQFAGLDPTALLDAIQRPDGARVGGSPSRTTGAPSFQAPSISPPSGGGNQPPPQQPEQPQQQQAQGPMPMPQQAPIIIGDPNGSSKKEDTTPKNVTQAPPPAKEDANAAERKGFNDGYAQAMALLRGAGGGVAAGAAAAARTGQKLTAGMFARGGSNARGGRRSNARQAPAFAGTGNTVSGRRSPSQFGRGNMSPNG